jgi:hypothetical protein
MKYALILCFFLLNLHFVNAQDNQLDHNTIWEELYPGVTDFDEEDRLITYGSIDGVRSEVRIKIGHIFNYTSNGKKRAVVILFSSPHDESGEHNCHLCHPDFTIAYFRLSNGVWENTSIRKKWSAAAGSWGNPAKVSMKKHNDKLCLVVSDSVSGNEGFYSETTYYDLITLKEVKKITEKE